MKEPSTQNDPLRNLDALPLFHLSLGSKELFHSDMIRWLCREYPTLMSGVLSDLMSLPLDQISIDPQDIKREFRHKDISIKLSDGRYVFIENKVKSLPLKDQLDRYASDLFEWRRKERAKQSKGQSPQGSDSEVPDLMLLLSLAKPMFDHASNNTGESRQAGAWMHSSYEDFAQSLRRMLESHSIEREYHRSLVTDYVDMIDNLVKLNNEIEIAWDTETFSFLDGDSYSRFAAARLHDFFYKRKYEQLAEKLKQELLDRGHQVSENPEDGEFAVYSGMTNATGLVSVDFMLSGSRSDADRIVLGVQVQHDMFRLFLEMDGTVCGKAFCALASSDNAGTPWVNFDQIDPNSGACVPKNREFLKFEGRDGRLFAYRYLKFSHKMRISDLIDHIVDYCTDASVRREELTRVISSC